MLLLLSSLSLITQTVYANNQANDISQEDSEAKLDKLKAGIKKMTNWLFQANDEKTGLNKELKKSELKINQLSKNIRASKNKIDLNKAELLTLS
mgnify:FL=1